MAEGGRGFRVRTRASGSFVLVYFVLMLINFFGTLVNMFISRQREFRADAISVRLTRDPLSLAEALYTISSRWRGASLSGEELEAIFILNPRFNALDESQGIFSNWFSTHPPVSQRITILLDMAHVSLESLEEDVEKRISRPRQPAPEAGESSVIKTYFQRGQIDSGRGLCPRCGITLNEVSYEGAAVLKCPQCQGVLAAPSDASRILIRRDYEFSGQIKKMAEVTKNEKFKPILNKVEVRAENFISCPRCLQKNTRMIRSFYSVAYCVEVDRCIYCGSVWFDKDELEILQYLVEKQTGLNDAAP